MQKAGNIKQHSPGMNVTLWIVTGLVAALFFVSGGAKIGGWADSQFVEWGYSTGFAVLIGILEVIFAIALLMRRTAAWGAFGLMVVMLGAVGTHLTHGEYAMLLMPIGVFLLLAFIAWGRGPERNALASRSVRRQPNDVPAVSRL